MKHSLKKQISVTFIGLTAITILVCLCANLLFLGRFYIGEKTGLLRSIYGMLDQASESGRIREDDYLVEFEQTASSSNIEALVIDPDMRIIFSNIRRSEVLSNRLVGFFLDDDNKINKIIFKNEDYQIQMTEDPGMKLEYIELWGLLSNGNMVVLRSPLDSIRESTKMANSFLCFVGGVAVLVSAVLISVITGRITKPILQLTDISKRMCDLDFNVRYEDTTANEIGVLGNNMNSLSKTLEKTISELKSANNELKKDNARKTEIDEMRREFLGNVSHELKTPIALIQGYAEGLKDCVNDDEESRNFYCDVIMDEAGKMNRLVKNLLELDALESGNDLVSMDRFDITELIRNCVSAQDILIKQNGIDMIFDRTDPKYVWADEFKVEQIVSNYLSNAIHYAKNEKVVEIRLNEEENGKVRVNVFNTGDPIPKESIDKLWNKFYKVDKARTREYGGSGIGLSIVKASMDAMNQKYGVRNYDNGVGFWFEVDGNASGD